MEINSGNIMDTISAFLDYELINLENYKIKVYSVVLILIILLSTKLIIRIIRNMMFGKRKPTRLGNAYAIFQLLKYVIWVIAISLVLETIGINLTLLLAGSAALLVGVGLGLQQTFNDIVSGLILLAEGSIMVDDVLEIDGDIVKIQSIGLRTSTASSRDDISIIIPNSLITTNKVINWSHQIKKTRFSINVGVAYGSDVELVSRILEESVLEHPDISDKKLIEARFLDFGESSLAFRVLFFSENVFRIEKVKSDIRRIINRKFIENKITIPYPQMDVHIKDK